RALAIGEMNGAAAGLEAMPSHDDDARLAGYNAYWAARADLLSRLQRIDESRAAFSMAIGLERDPAVRAHLQKRAVDLIRTSWGPPSFAATAWGRAFRQSKISRRLRCLSAIRRMASRSATGSWAKSTKGRGFIVVFRGAIRASPERGL